MTDANLPYLSATQALLLFRSRKLSPVELLDALIDRVEASESALNAVVDRRYDEARTEAKASAERYASKTGTDRPLDGVPVAAKEEHPMVGRSWTQGSLLLDGTVATKEIGRAHV